MAFSALAVTFLARTSGAIYVFGFVFLLFATVAFFASRQKMRERWRREALLQTGQRVKAMVVFHSCTGSGKNARYHAKMKYATPDGRTFRFRSAESWSKPWPPLGTKIALAYDPADPDFALVVKWPPEPPGGV